MTIDRRTVLSGGGLLAAASAVPGGLSGLGTRTAQAAVPARFNTVDASMRKAIEDGTAAGLVAVAASPDMVIYQGAFGKADTTAGTPMTADTVFWLLSMTKTFTATACMQLIEQGRLGLGQEAATVLPQLASPKVLDGFEADGAPRLRPAKRPILVRHLLTIPPATHTRTGARP